MPVTSTCRNEEKYNLFLLQTLEHHGNFLFPSIKLGETKYELILTTKYWKIVTWRSIRNTKMREC